MIMKGVCAATGRNPEQIRAKGGKRNQAREMTICDKNVVFYFVSSRC